MSSTQRMRVLWASACVALPILFGFLVYAISRDTLLVLVAIFCSSFVSWTVIRYVLIGRYQARLLAVTTVMGSAFFFASAVSLSRFDQIWFLIYELTNSIFPWIPPPPTNAAAGWGVNAVAFGMILAGVLVSRLIIRAPEPIEKAVIRPIPLSEKQEGSIIRSLTDHLDILDESLRFFDFRSPAIEPKLQQLNSTSRTMIAQTPDQVLVEAKEGAFVVVKGEPGSGKSVMLRNLTRRLLSKVGETGKIPLLLNLREWNASSKDNQIDMSASLMSWVRSEYCLRMGSRSASLLEEEFDLLYNQGGFIFLFDSFDEIRIINRSADNDARIRQISRCLADLVHASGGCIGFVYSRDYKSPSIGWVQHSVYGILPFSDSQIKDYITANSKDYSLNRAVFRERVDLYAMAKNPLLLALLVDYYNQESGSLPDTEFDIFVRFVSSRIGRALAGGKDNKQTYAASTPH